MAHIKITKGLDIPLSGKPHGNAKVMTPGGDATPMTTPPQAALDLRPFEDLKLRVLVKAGDVVKAGDPLVEDKSLEGRVFVSPTSGTVKDVLRGHKRVLQEIIIDTSKQQEFKEFTPIDPTTATRETVLEALLSGGLFASIRSRPFSRLADPKISPRSIFVKAVESAPFTPPAELQVEGKEHEFQTGLNALKKLTSGKVHLVYRKDTTSKAFTNAQGVEKHTVEGPHPVANHSLHIQHIDPILHPNDCVWTLNAYDVISIGTLLEKGKILNERVISIAGPGILPDRIGYFKVKNGCPIGCLIAGRLQRGENRLISGDPLTGHKVSVNGFLGYNDFVFCAIPENDERELLHFFRLGLNKYSMSGAYFTGHLNNENREYAFTTSQHGEHRPFIDSTLYDEVQPLHVPTMQLVKAVMAEDFDLAETFGILEVDSEDFALPTFVCPSKMEMTEIMKQGINRYAKEISG